MYPYRCMVMKLERRNNVSIWKGEIMCMVMKLERRNNVSISVYGYEVGKTK